MKTRTLILLVISLVVLSVLFTGSKKKKLTTEEAMEIIVGTWVNEENEDDWRGGKRIWKRDGTFEIYINVTDVESNEKGEFTLIDNMIDSNGNIWIKATRIFPGSMFGTIYDVYKINKSKTTLEIALSTKDWLGKDYPAEIEDDNIKYGYGIYYR